MSLRLRLLVSVGCLIAIYGSLFGQKNKVPTIHSNIYADNQGIYFQLRGKKFYALQPESIYRQNGITYS